ncbi:GNAT family N-acetyltransferase [Rhodococcus artemisiae]|uniref:GNAT family N-acetyltransferase n=1 Tax=Rhodococcus artemisiae TaxID=714159 RepID=A0ABU7LGB3_9NOCA|nr:GNAT family N-acetyltransferase [Rhodococcus artemisiae]MEE2060550.1 GNAT family N-acetyltransferase [Rhodococcus artemisiae]
MEARVLSDGRVTLSPPAPGDIDAITAACQDPAITEWTTMPAPYVRSDAVRFVGDIVPAKWARGYPDWAIRTSEGGRLCGMVGFVARGDAGPEIGYWVAPDARQRGLAVAAVRLACDFAFSPEGMGAWRIEWRAFVGNAPSASVARRSGFRFEGVARHGLIQRDTPRDVWVAGLLPDDPRTSTGTWPI